MQFLLPTGVAPANGIFTSPLAQQLQPLQSQRNSPTGIPQSIVNSNPVHGLKRALNFNADYGGCGYWRMLWPEMLINMNQLAVIGSSTAMIFDQRYYSEAQTVRIQRQAVPAQLQFAKYLRGMSDGLPQPFKLIYEIDDIVFSKDIPDYNACKYAFDDPIIEQTTLDIMKLCDEITVTCDFMKDYYQTETGVNANVVPNYVPRFWMDRFYSGQKVADRYERNKKRPRIGYFGSGTHTDAKHVTGHKDDFEHIIDVVTKTRKDFKWVFTGTIPYALREFIKSGDIEYYPWTSLENYPYAIDKADVSITIAPLRDNTFNRAKSNIKYLEAGCFGLPCICQDLVTYNGSPLKFKSGDDMIDTIKKLTTDRQLYTKHSKMARSYAETMWMEDHLDEYVKLYKVEKNN